MPYNKELYFFNYLNIKNTQGKNYSSDRLEWYSKQFELSLKNYFLKNLTLFKSYRTLRVLDYNLKRFFLPEIRGEATASYAAMEHEIIRDIFILNPDIKIILMLRNPIERAWSHAKHELFRQKGPRKILELQNYTNFYRNKYVMRCGLYTQIIEKWLKFAPDKNLFIGFFDDINKNPKNLLLRVLHFLNVSHKLKSNSLKYSRKTINSTINIPIPRDHYNFLANIFSDENGSLNKLFNLNWES